MQGLESTVSIGKQADATDPTTLARQSLNIYGITGGQTESDEDDDILGGGLENGSDPVAPAPGLDEHRVQVRVPACIAQLPWWFAAFFGTEAAGGDDPDYTHTWKSGQALPYIFLEHKLKTGRYRRHFGLVGESLEVDWDAERSGFAMVTMSFIGLKETTATTALTGTVTPAPTLDRPAQKLVNMIYDGVSGGDIMGGRLQFNRTLKRVRAADGSGVPYKVELDGTSRLEGSLRLRYDDDSFVDDGIAKTARAFSIELMRTAARGLQFEMDNMRLSRTPIDIDGPDGVEYEMAFKAWQDSDSPALRAIALNGSATVAFS